MAEGPPVEDLVLEEIKRDCKADCPYKWGDGDTQRVSLKTRVRRRLRFRVAWGDEVRILERKLEKLRNGVSAIISSAIINSAGSVGLTVTDIKLLNRLLEESIHDPVQSRLDG